MSLRSLGRSYTQTLSSLSTASPVTPPTFHLFGMVLGQSGSNLYFGAADVCAPTETHNAPKHRLPSTTSQVVLVMGFVPIEELACDTRRRSVITGAAIVND